MPRRLLGVLIILLVPVIGRAQGESVLLRNDVFRMKVEVAGYLGLDTLSEFRTQLEYFHRQLTEKNVRKEKQDSRQDEWIQVAAFTRRLGQHISKTEEIREKSLMDSIYVALKDGVYWESLAKKYVTTEDGGKPQWKRWSFLLEEWQNVLGQLKEGEISEPFFSPLGIHVVKWMKKGQRGKEEEPNSQDVLEDSIREALLVALLEKKYYKPIVYTDADLEHFFKANRKKYAWELPHYRGAVIHCRDKKQAKRIKKLLKKHPFADWNEVFVKTMGRMQQAPRMECGIFQIGTNPYIDKLVFKCGEYMPVEGSPYTFVLGKKMKKGPASYEDVKGKVIRDYLAKHENDWLFELKTVNNGGSY